MVHGETLDWVEKAVAGGATTRAAIVAELGLSPSQTTRALRKLVELGRLEVSGETKARAWSKPSPIHSSHTGEESLRGVCVSPQQRLPAESVPVAPKVEVAVEGEPEPLSNSAATRAKNRELRERTAYVYRGAVLAARCLELGMSDQEHTALLYRCFSEDPAERAAGIAEGKRRRAELSAAKKEASKAEARNMTRQRVIARIEKLSADERSFWQPHTGDAVLLYQAWSQRYRDYLDGVDFEPPPFWVVLGEERQAGCSGVLPKLKAASENGRRKRKKGPGRPGTPRAERQAEFRRELQHRGMSNGSRVEQNRVAALQVELELSAARIADENVSLA